MLVSPLRYPGGKAKLFRKISSLISTHGLYEKTYCEPYAGGAGLALRLLESGFTRRVILNDLDVAIYSFWKAALNRTDQFCDLIRNTPVDVDEWRRQRDIYASPANRSELELGFATYFLNRTSRSGIIEGAGPIGGYLQEGDWKIDVRFPREAQIANIVRLSRFSSQIEIKNLDAVALLSSSLANPDVFFYLDPPYYVKGAKLYKNFYGHDDHAEIAKLLRRNRNAFWALSYDDAEPIRNLYRDFRPDTYSLQYSVGQKGTGREVMYLSDRFADRAMALMGVDGD